MTENAKKQGIPRASNGLFPQGDTLPDTLPKTGSFHRGETPRRVSQGIPFLKKDGRGGYSNGQGAQGVLPPFIGNRYPGYPVAHHPDAGNKPKPPTKRAQRRLKKRAKAIAQWWACLPSPRPFFFTPEQLSEALGLDTQRLAAALTSLGWTRTNRRINHRSGTYWLPPGSPIAHWPPYTPRQFTCL